jgi:hypothetical protein
MKDTLKLNNSSFEGQPKAYLARVKSLKFGWGESIPIVGILRVFYLKTCNLSFDIISIYP